ncbi:MAG TPA: hypothetical protein VFL13_02855 [Candidatus Baltobacteraceae bacterium]|nr:hypothetical protein [Candidatus Baltobacteraceae bacterium]
MTTTRFVIALGIFVLSACGSRVTPVPLEPIAQPPIDTEVLTQASPLPGTAPLHIHGTMAWYQGEQINVDIPAAWMAQHYDFTEQGDAGSAFANSFMAAGGKYAVLYTDPEIVPRCNSPFATASGAKPGTCAGPMGSSLNGVETAWLHDKYGNRLHVTAYGTQPQGYWQDRVNPNYASLPSVYRSWVSSIILTNRWNAVEADDFQSGYDPSYFTYKFGATAREFDALGTTANSTWLAAQQRIFAASPKPVLINGILPYAASTAIASTNVLGVMLESCATTVTTTGVGGTTWIANMNELLLATSLHKYAVCINYAPTVSNGVAERLYGLASWWLTYDSTYSVNFVDVPTSDKHEVYPEHGIAVYSPVTSPTTSIAALRTVGGVYLREFAYCYVNKVAIGACAAEVNPDSVAHSVPVTHYAYKHYLSLTSTSWYSGGAVAWVAGTFTTLPMHSARILKI